MPQMFPMPVILLMVIVCILCLLSIVRVFWQMDHSVAHSLRDFKSEVHKFKHTW